jgi:glutathione S-transferase
MRPEENYPPPFFPCISIPARIYYSAFWALGVMDRELRQHPFLIGDSYSTGFPSVLAWLDRVAKQPKFIPQFSD